MNPLPLMSEAPKRTQKILLHPSDRLVDARGYDVQIQPIAETDPARSAYRQSLLGPNVMLWIGGRTQAVMERFQALIAAATKYPNIKSVYIYDEWGWSHDLQKVQIGLHENEVMWGAKLARSAGFETVISMLPHVILHPDFKMREINAFNLVAIDVYPINGSFPTTDTTYDANIYSDMLYSSYVRLREHGYTGKIGYIAQGFGDWNAGYDETLLQLTMQKETMKQAIALGVDACMYWGRELGAAELAAEPWIIPLGGTSFAPMVSFD